MKKILSIMAIHIKTGILRPTFVIKLVFLSILLLMAGKIAQGQSESMRVLLYANGSVKASQIIEELKQTDYEGFDFEEASSIDELTDSVLVGESVCGFVFGDDFDRKVASGDVRGCIDCYMSAQRGEGYVVKELVFPIVLKAFSPALLESYIVDNDSNVTRDTLDTIKNYYDGVLAKQDINIFTHITLSGNRTSDNRAAGIDTFWLFIYVVFALSILSVIEMNVDYKDYLCAFKLKDRYIFEMQRVMLSNVVICVVISMIFFTGKIIESIICALICTVLTLVYRIVTVNDKLYTILAPGVIVVGFVIWGLFSMIPIV